MRKILLLVLALTAPLQSEAETLSGRASVIDGDTIEIHGQRIRLFGVDAPEMSQHCLTAENKPWRCGQKAALALADHIHGKTVACEEQDWDRYGRMVAICSTDGDLALWMVFNGWATAYRRYSEIYIGAEDQARIAQIGLWAGAFEDPAQWRKSSKKP